MNNKPTRLSSGDTAILPPEPGTTISPIDIPAIPYRAAPKSYTTPARSPRRWRLPVILLVLVCLIGGGAALGIHVLGAKHTTPQSAASTAQPSAPKQTADAPSITWQKPYKDLGDLHLFTGTFNNESFFHYYLVGRTSDNHQVILVGSSSIASATAPNSLFTDIGYLVHVSGKYLFLKDALSGIYKIQSVDNSTASLKPSSDVEPNSDYKLPDLQLPSQLTLADKTSTQLEKTTATVYADLGFPNGHNGLTATKMSGNAPGSLYVETQKGTNGQYASVDYLLYRPDLRVATYRIKLDLPFKNGIPSITWTDGSKNTAKYSQTQPPMCGQTPGDVFANYVSTSQLEQVGKSPSDKPVYRYKNAYASLQNAYYTADKAQRFDSKMTAQEFWQDKNILLYQDVLGHYTVLVNTSSPLTSC